MSPLGLVKFIETEGRTVVARGGMGSYYLMRTEFHSGNMQKMDRGDGCTTV